MGTVGVTVWLLVVCLALLWLVVGVVCALVYQLVRQNGGILLQLEAIHVQLERLIVTPGTGLTIDPAAVLPMAPSTPQGLPLGSPAPAFTLPDLNDTQMRLEDYRGKHLLFIAWDPNCGFCRAMAPDLAVLPLDGSKDHPLPLLVTTGDAAQNQKLVEEAHIRCPVLLQEGFEVTTSYKAGGTPSGYRIDADGTIASELTMGAEALLALTTPATSGNGRRGRRVTRPLEESRLLRTGLPPGTPAPAFRLPLLTGGEVSLEEFRGRQVLLVFSSPDCGPCQALAPQLEQLYHRPSTPDVLMISRGDPAINHQKVAEHGLTFPVALQRQWEISRAYGMFATPIGFLIDGDGNIAAPVAEGADAILALGVGDGRTESPEQGKAVVPMDA
jgi:peroxiredoxin